MPTIRPQLASLHDLPEILPHLLQDLSIGRAQIVVDQIRGLLDDGHQDSVLVVTAVDQDSASNQPGSNQLAKKPLAAAIAIHPPRHGESTSKPSDSATLLHAGWMSDVADAERPEIIQRIKSHLDKTLSQRGVHFVQWACDAFSVSDVAQTWLEGLGFRWVADLEYMTKSLEPSTEGKTRSNSRKPAPHRLRLSPLQWNDESALPAFTELVDQTYENTLDCPSLLEYRSAEQTVAGYQANASFAPECWFTVSKTTPVENDDKPIGVAILARHNAKRKNANQSSEMDTNRERSNEVVELVYMGLVPSARGQRLGIELIRSVIATAKGFCASRLILAVDQQNDVASDLYRGFGLQPMLEESVWVKSL
ncbi:nourseothricin acetyltransferase-like protein [Rhodopirellula maiorica SM1]|uniref:Nourseothricin acetyltransferase-like protein n=1 Tax=Rhodopirellula maiorica SM1 TaxID=1265738 RepID=M5RRD1_9BACT|nr:GNAT family N-acetyltransferase [Rhodopirellula maiorica]EMI21835.1 nourseothricin acetyltransferase-like protein [Rhodopirellula maiorica SM1]